VTATDSLDWAALGYTIHAAFTCIENHCLRVAKTFENGLDDTSWHRGLLDRMTLDIPEIRPALLDAGARRLLDELRAFRHVFRTLYSDRLDAERLRLTQGRFGPALEAFRQAHALFAAKVAAIRDGLEG